MVPKVSRWGYKSAKILELEKLNNEKDESLKEKDESLKEKDYKINKLSEKIGKI